MKRVRRLSRTANLYGRARNLFELGPRNYASRSRRRAKYTSSCAVSGKPAARDDFPLPILFARAPAVYESETCSKRVGRGLLHSASASDPRSAAGFDGRKRCILGTGALRFSSKGNVPPHKQH